MRHISILVMVLLISTSASAAVAIVVDGATTLDPLQTVGISIVTTGENVPAYYVLGITEGEPGLLIDDTIRIQSSGTIYPPETEPPIPGLSSWIMFGFESLEPIPAGILLEGVVFRCEGPGNVNMLLYELSADFLAMGLADSRMIYQTPEPGTIALLGLGAILLKRRR